MRRLIALVALCACAQPGLPPGGPRDEEPPRVVQLFPDTNALNVRAASITFQFSEVVSERPQGARSLAEIFEVSPSRGEVAVSWRRSRVEVVPRGGLQPNTTYTVRLLPGVVDLANNVDSTGLTLVFSTGPALASGVVSGRVFDWTAARPAPLALVEAVSLPDSAIHATTADSTGLFAIRHMPPGTYLLRALVDQNRNRTPDPRELMDSITVTLSDSISREMLGAVRDLLGPGLSAVELRDSTFLRLTLDRPLDTAFVASLANFILKAADSSAIPLGEVVTQAEMDRRAADSARVKAVQDSVRAAAQADSALAADTARVAPPQPARPTGRRPGATARVAAVPAVDTAKAELPRPAARIPVTVLYARLTAPLKPDAAFRLRGEGLVSVTGARRSSERVFNTPKPAARPDSTRPPAGRPPRD